MTLPTRTPVNGWSTGQRGRWAIVRTIEGPGTVTTDAASPTVPSSAADIAAQTFDAAALESVLVTVEFDSGSGTLELEPLFLDQEGGRWTKDLVGDPGSPVAVMTPALSPGQTWEVVTFGRKVFFRVNAVTGAPVGARILVLPAKLLP